MYAEHLEDNLQSLLDRAKSGRYRAPPVRRVHIPKGDGTETRPIGIPAFEDKVLQCAVAMVIGEVYEQEFTTSRMAFALVAHPIKRCARSRPRHGG
jgi:retron-type reverse transcriptase